MSAFRFGHELRNIAPALEEIAVVLSRQNPAIADDFLRKLFPELTPDRLPYPGPFTVFISDDECVLH